MTAFNEKNLEILMSAIGYTGATISPGNTTKSNEKPDYILVHKGRVQQSYSYLRQAEEVLAQMMKELGLKNKPNKER